MKNIEKDFKLFAKDKGVSSMGLHQYQTEQIKAQTPYIMEERQMNVTQLDVFSRLLMERIIWLSGPIEDFNSTVIQAQLMYLENVDKNKDITIHIDSGGGIIAGGKKIISVMEYISCDIVTINTGLCASMAAVILGAGTKGKRGGLKYSRTMIHSSSGGMGGVIHDVRIAMKEWERENEELFEMLGSYCGKTSKQIQEDAERDKWLSVTESIEYGLIDEEVKSRKQ